MNFEEEAEKVLNDAYKMGLESGRSLWDDYPQLKAGMVKQLQKAALETALKSVGTDECYISTDSDDNGYDLARTRNTMRAEIRANLKRHFKQEEVNDE